MAKKITELPAASSVAPGDTVLLVQGGTTKKATVSQLPSGGASPGAKGQVLETFDAGSGPVVRMGARDAFTLELAGTGTLDDIASTDARGNPCGVIRWTGALPATITGIAGGTESRRIEVWSLSSAGHSLELSDSGASAVSNQLMLPAEETNLTLPYGSHAILSYDATLARWHVVGGTAVDAAWISKGILSRRNGGTGTNFGSLTGQANKVIAVNAAGTSFELQTPTGGATPGGSVGDIQVRGPDGTFSFVAAPSPTGTWALKTINGVLTWAPDSSSPPDWTSCYEPNGNVYDPVRLATSTTYQERDGARLVYFLGKYWLIGGWWPEPNQWNLITTNEIRSSTDLINWTLELAHDASPPVSGAGARWRPRHTFGCVVMGGYVWVVGTDQYDTTLGWGSDVWRSSDMITWERVAASSPWGPAQIPIVVAYNNQIHVLGGYVPTGGVEDIFTSHSSAQHWSSADGVTWTRHADMPFQRAATDAVVQCGKLIIFGGSQGNPYTSRTFPADTWAWDGTTWHQQSADSGSVWVGRDWAATCAYDNKIWLTTGVTKIDGQSINMGGAYYSEDLGATWQATHAPWNASHADALAVGPHGIAIVSGNGQSNNTYRLTAETRTTPHLASLSLWCRAQYLTAPWRGTKSAGASFSRTLTETEPTFIPSQGLALDGYSVADFDGTNDIIQALDGFLDAFITPSSWWIGMLVYVDTTSAPQPNAYDDRALISDDAGGWGIFHSTSGVRAVNYDGAFKATPHAALATGTWAWVEAWLSGGTLSVSVNGGTPQTVSSGNLLTLGIRTIRVGANWNKTACLDGKVAEVMVAGARPASMMPYLKARYPSAGLP